MHERIGKYHVIRAAGSGGFGTVYEGYDVELDRNVAIKICTSDDEGQLQRFRREARVVSQLKHRNVALVYDYGFDPTAGLHFLVEEFLSGVDLEKKILERDRLPSSLRLRYVMEIAQGLEFVHNRGLIHRDLTPRNVRVLHDHSIKLMDFGLAKDVTDSTLTLIGDNFGTVGYTAPEQITGMRTVDQRTDIFSLGVIAYELLSWTNPFKAESMGSFIHKVNNVDPTPLDEIWRECPKDLAETVHLAIRKSPDERFDSCSDMLPVLKRALRFLRDHEIPPPLATQSFLEETGDGIHVVGGDIRLDTGTAPRSADDALSTVDLDSFAGSLVEGEESGYAAASTGPLSSWRRLLPGAVAGAAVLVVLLLVAVPALRRGPGADAATGDAVAGSPAVSPGSAAGGAPSGETVPAPPASSEAAPPPPRLREAAVPASFWVRARSKGTAEKPVIVLQADLPELAGLSHCYVVRTPEWSVGGKIRRDCVGGSFIHSDRLELSAGEGYTYRIQLAGPTGDVLAEAITQPVVAGPAADGG